MDEPNSNKKHDKIKLESIIKIIDDFKLLTNVYVTIYDNDNNIIKDDLTNCICGKFCNLKNSSQCIYNTDFSLNYSKSLGEPYFYTCECNFINCVISIYDYDDVLYSVIIGPIVLENIKDLCFKSLIKLNSNNINELYQLHSFLNKCKTFSTSEVNSLSNILNNSILGINIQNDFQLKINSEYKSQSNIGQKIYENKTSDLFPAYPSENEKQLIDSIKHGNINKTKELLKRTLDDILVLEYGNIDYIKARLFEICTVLSRLCTNISSIPDDIFSYNVDFIKKINSCVTLNEISQCCTEMVTFFSELAFSKIYTGNSDIINKAIIYTNENYIHNISLKKLSEILHVNYSYLSNLFKKELDMNYVDYLNMVRLNKSRDLLKHTDMSIVDIALCVGFENQSYYTKSFKKYFDTTPSKYRKCQF